MAVVTGQYWLFAATVLVGSLVNLALRRRTPEANADERDHQIDGASALMALQIFAWIGLGAAFLLFYYQDRIPQFATIAGTLTIAAAGVMILYGLIDTYLRRVQNGRLGLFSAFAAFLVVALVILSLRLLSGEDDWICSNGTWVMHGHPTAEAPSTPCPEPR